MRFHSRIVANSINPPSSPQVYHTRCQPSEISEVLSDSRERLNHSLRSEKTGRKMKIGLDPQHGISLGASVRQEQ